MLYAYLSGKSLPGHSVLRRACSAWNLELSYKNLIVNTKSFPQPAQHPDDSNPVQLQLDLQEALEHLRNEDLGVQILRRANGRLELRIDVRFGVAT